MVSDRGAGTVLALAVLAAVIVLTGLALPLAVALVARQAAAGAADAAALAAADVAAGIHPGFPCEVDGLVVTVVASRSVLGFAVLARSTAGPAPSSPIRRERGGSVYGVAGRASGPVIHSQTTRSPVPGTKKLVIVESPTKAKTIAQYLGEGYEVLSSVGHIRDLIEPKNLPPELKKGSLGKFSVDVENGFEPYYVVSDAKKKTVADLKRALKDADELYLATDEDREGEAIAWHLLQELKLSLIHI